MQEEQYEDTPVEPVEVGVDEEDTPDPVEVGPDETQSAEPSLPVLTTSPVVETEAVDTAITSPLEGDGWHFELPTEEIQKRIQEALAATGSYQGKRNGRWGNLSVFAIGEAVGYPTQVPDRELCVRIQNFAIEQSGMTYTEEAQGYLDQEAWEDFALALEEEV